MLAFVHKTQAAQFICGTLCLCNCRVARCMTVINDLEHAMYMIIDAAAMKVTQHCSTAT